MTLEDVLVTEILQEETTASTVALGMARLSSDKHRREKEILFRALGISSILIQNRFY
jgi:hypothetical protein